MASCNKHGVYKPDEVLSLPRKVKGWRGLNICDIEIANLGSYWIWATSFQMHGGDYWGSASPLADDWALSPVTHRAESRDAAISAASAYLRDKLEKRAGEYADARAIMAWLETLQPDQPDLFAPEQERAVG